MRKLLLAGLFTLCLIWPVAPHGEEWDNPGFEDEPADGDQVSEADDRMRETKEEVRRRGEVEHWWGAVAAPPGDDDNGLHRVGSARVFLQDAAPTALDGGAGDYEYSAETEQAETDLDDSASNSGGAIEDDVGHARLWVDSNTTPDNKLSVFMGVAGDGNGAWEDVAVDVGMGDDEILAGSFNLVYNGSFEATDGTGDAASVVVPDGWADGANVCVHAYNDPSTDVLYGDGFEYECGGAGGANALIEQELILGQGQTYKVIARAKDDGTTVCTLDVANNAGAAFVPDSTTTNDWETLSGTFGTDAAALDTVQIQLIRVTDTQDCLWDHVAIYRIDDVTTDRDEVVDPSNVALRDVDNAVAAVHNTGADNANLALSFTPPTSGYILQVGYEISAGDTAQVNDASLTCYLAEGGVEVNGTRHSTTGNAAGNDELSLSSVYLDATPVAGTTLSYTVWCTDAGGTLDYNSPGGTDSVLWLIPHAPR